MNLEVILPKLRFKVSDWVVVIVTIAMIATWVWLFVIRSEWRTIDISQAGQGMLVRVAQMIIQRHEGLYLVFIVVPVGILATYLMPTAEVYRLWVRAALWVFSVLGIVALALVVYAMKLSLISY